MPQTFNTEQWVPFSVELVFAFFANPANLPHLMPPKLQTRIEDARITPPPARPGQADPARRFKSIAAGQGSEILISFLPVPWVPRRVSWLARINEFEWNSHFTDEQLRGPFRSFHHRHGVKAQVREGVEGTCVSDDIVFDMPLGALGRMIGLIVRQNLARSFAYRQTRLPEILAAAALQAVKRA